MGPEAASVLSQAPAFLLKLAGGQCSFERIVWNVGARVLVRKRSAWYRLDDLAVARRKNCDRAAVAVCVVQTHVYARSYRNRQHIHRQVSGSNFRRRVVASSSS